MKRTEFIEKMSGIDPKYVSEAANYRPKRMVCIRVIAIAACLAMMLTTVTVWGLTLTMEKSAYDTICELAETKDGVFSVSKLDQKEIFFDLSQENLNEIFSAFDIILEKNDKVELDGGSFVKDVLRKTEYIEKDGKIIVSTDADSNKLKYAMFASVFIQNFPDNTRPFYTEEEKRMMSHVIIGSDIIISFDYKDFGYKNTDEYFNDKRNTSEIGEKTYRLSSSEIDMYAVKGNYYGSPTENVLSMLNPGVTGRQESMSKTNNISDLPPEILEQFKDLLTD